METAILVGFFGLAGVVLGRWMEMRQAEKQADLAFERQRRLAEEQHAREVNKSLTEELSSKIDNELLNTQTILLAANGVRYTYEIALLRSQQITPSDRADSAKRIMNRHGLGIDQQTEEAHPRATQVAYTDLEDEELLQLVRKLREGISELYSQLLTFGDFPESLLDSFDTKYSNLFEIRQQVDFRRRELLRLGRPL